MNENSLCCAAQRSPERAPNDKPAPAATGPERGRSVPGALLTAATMVGAVLATAALLAGCASSSGVAAPSHALIAPAQLGAVADGNTPWPRANWWADWGDTQLNALIDQALAQQPSLQTVQARLAQAQAAVDVANAARSPQVYGSLALTDQRFTKNGLVPPPLAGTIRWTNDAQIGASWELDLFGRQRAALDSAIGQLRAAQADAQAARVLLAGNVAASYVTLARLVETRALSQEALR